jgi:alanyl-tRNA synthetase
MQIDPNGEITEIRFIDGQYALAIRHESLFPGGGGQPSDHAQLKASSGVYHLHEVSWQDKIPFWLIPGGILMLREPVEITIDPLWRLEMSQQHSAQHLLSGLALKLYGWESTGFSIFDKTSKIEFLTASEDENLIEELEKEVIRHIAKNLPIRTHEEVADSHERCRTVTIEGVDRCGCGGTHVENTSLIGAFSILSQERKNKNALRIVFAAGLRLGKIAKTYTKWEQELRKKLTGDVNERIDDLLQQMHRSIKNEKKWIQELGQHLPINKEKWLIIRNLPAQMEALRQLASIVHQRGGNIFLLTENGHFVFTGTTMQALFSILREHGAKGGGSTIINGTMDLNLAKDLERLIEKL